MTGYIDFIDNELMTHNVMAGLDYYGRPFLSIKVNAFNEKT